MLQSDVAEELTLGMEMEELPKSNEDKSELLYFGRMPGSKRKSPLSQEVIDLYSIFKQIPYFKSVSQELIDLYSFSNNPNFKVYFRNRKSAILIIRLL